MSSADLRLTRCEACSRVFDTREYKPGETFSCHCGVTILVRARQGHDSPVIRCSSCGGSRAPNAAACTFCGASFTLREHQLTAMCASCGARASGRDAYCHACGEVIVTLEQATQPGQKTCPVCESKPTLMHRLLQTSALLECHQCGGVWLDRGSFVAMTARAREIGRGMHGPGATARASAARPQPGPAYRRCIECDNVMQRKNYGRRSGVIVDICAKHGVWFDLHELEDILAWLRSGGTEAPEPVSPSETKKMISPRMTDFPAAAPSEKTVFEGAAELVFDILRFFG